MPLEVRMGQVFEALGHHLARAAARERRALPLRGLGDVPVAVPARFVKHIAGEGRVGGAGR